MQSVYYIINISKIFAFMHLLTDFKQSFMPPCLRVSSPS